MEKEGRHKPLESGMWPDGTRWELFATNEHPPENLCTSTFCIPIIGTKGKEKIMLARHRERDWGVIGGHIEEGESESDALEREAREEGGIVVLHARELLAVCKMTSKQPTYSKSGRLYPFPIGYMTYSLATIDQPLIPPTGEEIIEAGSFSIDNLPYLNPLDQRVVQLGWEAYQRKQ